MSNDNKKLILSSSVSYGSVPKDEASSLPNISTSENEGCFRRFHHAMFPRGLKKETKEVLHITWPLTVCQITIFFLGPVSLVIAGHLGNLELAAVALAISMLNVTGISVMIGLVTACDTLFSNAYGSINKTLVGVYTQRSLYIIPLFCFPCWALHVNSKNLFVALGQDPKVSELAERYLLAFSPGLLFCGLHQVLYKFLVNQNIVIPNVFLGLLGNLANVAMQCLFVLGLNLGIEGCALGQACGFLFLFVFTLAYILKWKVYKDTWSGWSWKALEDWGMFIWLALAGFIMVAMEWWTFEFGIFMSGILSNVYLTANSLTFNLESLFYAMPMSFGVAASVRVGQFLGAGDAIGAKNSARVAQFIAIFGFGIEAILILSLRNYLPLAFTNDKIVSNMVSGLLIWLMVVLGMDAITAVSTGILRGAGRQKIGALANLLGFFAITLPLAYLFMFKLNQGAYGFWYGLMIGISPLCIFYVFLTQRLNWDDEVTKALKRIEVDDVTQSLASDIKSGEFNLKRVSKTLPNKLSLIISRLVIIGCFLVVFAAGLTTRYLTTVCHHQRSIRHNQYSIIARYQILLTKI